MGLVLQDSDLSSKENLFFNSRSNSLGLFPFKLWKFMKVRKIVTYSQTRQKAQFLFSFTSPSPVTFFCSPLFSNSFSRVLSTSHFGKDILVENVINYFLWLSFPNVLYSTRIFLLACSICSCPVINSCKTCFLALDSKICPLTSTIFWSAFLLAFSFPLLFIQICLLYCY